MSVHLEMQIEELEEELAAIKAINQKLQLEKNAIKEQFSLQGVSHQRELLIAYQEHRQECNDALVRHDLKADKYLKQLIVA